ncbi:MAG: OmpA family protein [Bacteroidota bacterium]
MNHSSRTLFGLGLFISCLVNGQNLVINGGFEEYKTCPSNFTNVDATLEAVATPTSSSGDYFNTCSSTDFGVPTNFKGEQKAFEGTGYIGLYFYALNDYREYLQLNTTRTLREKYPHKISLKVSLAEASTLAIRDMAIVFTNKKIKLPNSSTLTNGRLDLQQGLKFQKVKLIPEKSLDDTAGWVTLTAEFEAKGFENYMILGNFQPNKNTRILEANRTIRSGDFSYYYIDDFTMEELPRVNYEKDKIYVLEQNPYEPKGYKLDGKAMASVKKIFKYLRENAEVQMKITGHSDSSGTPEYNKFISSLRARAVALYLKKLGIDDDRIVWEGVGDSKPLRNGKIKQDHLANRRVEFVMTTFDEQ